MKKSELKAIINEVLNESHLPYEDVARDGIFNILDSADISLGEVLIVLNKMIQDYGSAYKYGDDV